jgi:ABC-type antimicrobial peptide transport system permease subunit
MKILLAGILGGIVMFIWTSIAHMALPLGEAGIREIPNESAALSAMQSNIGENTGLYIFPGPGIGKNATRQEKNEAMKHVGEKMAANPSGILMYHVSYWNWYGFPGVYTASYILIELVGFFLVGVAAGLVLRKRSPAG